MRSLWVNMTISFLAPSIMIFSSVIINKMFLKLDVFECGFDSSNVSVLPISLRFFMFCIIFIVLDLELISMPLCPIILSTNLLIINLYIFITLASLGLVIEWGFGSMSWAE